jgi:hypothetical protein
MVLRHTNPNLRCCLTLFRSFILVVTLLAAGCVRIEQDLVLQPDGSGTLRFRYEVKDEDIRRMKELSDRMAALDPELAPEDVHWVTAFDEQAIRDAWAASTGPGVTLRDVRTGLEGAWRTMTAEIAFDSLQQLLDCGMVEECTITLTRGAGGQYGYVQAMELGASARSLPGGMDLETLKPMLNLIMKDFRATFRVETPGDIVRSNADREEGRAAVWEITGTQPDLYRRLQDGLLLRIQFAGSELQLADARSGR